MYHKLCKSPLSSAGFNVAKSSAQLTVFHVDWKYIGHCFNLSERTIINFSNSTISRFELFNHSAWYLVFWFFKSTLFGLLELGFELFEFHQNNSSLLSWLIRGLLLHIFSLSFIWELIDSCIITFLCFKSSIISSISTHSLKNSAFFERRSHILEIHWFHNFIASNLSIKSFLLLSRYLICCSVIFQGTSANLLSTNPITTFLYIFTICNIILFY